MVGLKRPSSRCFPTCFPARSYQLQLSADMNSWTNFGSPFTPTNTVMDYPQYFDRTSGQTFLPSADDSVTGGG